MFAAGPGTITAVVTLAAFHTPDGFPVTAVVAAVIGAAVTLLVLLVAVKLASHLGRGTQSVVTRFMGLIVASMGMQFVLTGLKEFLIKPGLIAIPVKPLLHCVGPLMARTRSANARR
jgi:multiple antibiotic resistance protein